MNTTSERKAYVYIQLPGTLKTVPVALLKVEQLRDGTHVGRFRYGDRYLARAEAVELDPFELLLGNALYEFTKLKGIAGAVRDAGPDRRDSTIHLVGLRRSLVSL
jgi:serine/threonine-protein kinase HipA